MLRIKKEIDLKDLEKFGFSKVFKYKGSLKQGLYGTLKGLSYILYDEDENSKNSILYIDKKSRIVEIEDFDFTNKEKVENTRSEIINKLIQAGYVEKVEE